MAGGSGQLLDSAEALALSRVDDPVALHAEIDRAISGCDAQFDHVSCLQVLLPAGLNLR